MFVYLWESCSSNCSLVYQALCLGDAISTSHLCNPTSGATRAQEICLSKLCDIVYVVQCSLCGEAISTATPTYRYPYSYLYPYTLPLPIPIPTSYCTPTPTSTPTPYLYLSLYLSLPTPYLYCNFPVYMTIVAIVSSGSEYATIILLS